MRYIKEYDQAISKQETNYRVHTAVTIAGYVARPEAIAICWEAGLF
jgi:hypothetical protein